MCLPLLAVHRRLHPETKEWLTCFSFTSLHIVCYLDKMVHEFVGLIENGGGGIIMFSTERKREHSKQNRSTTSDSL